MWGDQGQHACFPVRSSSTALHPRPVSPQTVEPQVGGSVRAAASSGGIEVLPKQMENQQPHSWPSRGVQRPWQPPPQSFWPRRVASSGPAAAAATSASQAQALLRPPPPRSHRSKSVRCTCCCAILLGTRDADPPARSHPLRRPMSWRRAPRPALRARHSPGPASCCTWPQASATSTDAQTPSHTAAPPGSRDGAG